MCLRCSATELVDHSGVAVEGLKNRTEPDVSDRFGTDLLNVYGVVLCVVRDIYATLALSRALPGP